MRNEVKRYALLPYTLRVVPEECTDGSSCFLATHPELPGCMSHGATVEEAIQNLAEARELYIAELLERGLEVPMPVAVTSVTYSVGTIIWQVNDAPISPRSEGLAQPSLPEEIPYLQPLAGTR